MESIDQSNRIGYLDTAKGIGILLVVLGHSDIGLISPYLHQFIYSFHMPLFFALSGYFFNVGAPIVIFVSKRFNSILKPYLFTIFLIYITSISFSNMGFKTALGRIGKSFYATPNYLEWVPLWFLPSLFVTSLMAYFVYKGILARVRNRYFRWLVLLTLLAFGVMIIGTFYPFSVFVFGKEYELYGLPFSLDIVLISSFFYILGSEVRYSLPEKVLDNRWFLLFITAGLITLNWVFSYRTDIASRMFQSLPINTVEAILGILLILALSKQIDTGITWLASVLRYIGQASLFILIFHLPIQESWGTKIHFVTENDAFSILVAFVISTVISLGIYKVFVEHNPLVQFLYGRTSSFSTNPEDESKENSEK